MNGTMVMNGTMARSDGRPQDRFALDSRMDGNHMTGNHMTGNHMTGNHMTGNHMTGNHMTGNHMTGKNRFALDSRMNGNHMTGNHMTGTMSRSTASDKSRFALDSRTGAAPIAMNGVMVRSDTANSKKLALRRSHRGSGMGTTGSLGVSFAAPLTRGGFPGEIFYSPPMPTGHWKDAPSPVMLGTEAASAALDLLTPNKDDMQKYLVGAVAGLAIGFLAYKLLFSR
jgi:hypothetical protein